MQDRRVVLPLPDADRQGGWYLLQGRLLRFGGDFDARLYWETGLQGAPTAYLPVSTSVKGTLNEVLRLPAGVQRLLFDPGTAAERELGALRLTRLGGWQRRWRMLRRVLPQLWLQPREKRLQIGLTWSRAWSDLAGAYEAASRLRAHAAAPSYRDWVASFATPTQHDRQRMAQHLQGWTRRPFFHVLLLGPAGAARERTRASLDAQLHRSFDCAVLDDTTALRQFNDALARAPGLHWVLMLHAGDVMAPHMLYWMAAMALAEPAAAVLYADEDIRDPQGEHSQPQFKPGWSWNHARSTRFMGEAVALRADVLAAVGGLTAADCRHGSYDAVLRVLDAAGGAAAGPAAVHIPAVLLHRAPAEAQAGPEADAWAMQAVRAHLARRGVAAQVMPQRPGCWRVRYALPPEPPRVSVIVPTRDALALTRRCIESLRRLTRYAQYEVLLVDNQSTDPDALAWMREQAAQGRVRLLHDNGPFNYAAINNMAVRAAQGELVCLLNNDTEVLEPDWLEEMVAQLLQPGVDVVGAKLLYPNGRVQHAGDLIGVGGVANHAFAWLERDAPGYGNRAVVAQEYSAVTAACLLTWRQRYLGLGGLDERHLPVAFNDVDYCLRVREHGGHVVWTPHAVLLHHESVSRGKDQTAAQKRRALREAAYMRRRWGHVMGHDPFYNPNLSHERADFSLSHAPVVHKPWVA